MRACVQTALQTPAMLALVSALGCDPGGAPSASEETEVAPPEVPTSDPSPREGSTAGELAEPESQRDDRVTQAAAAEPCAGRNEEGPVVPLCIWTDPAELARIHEQTHASIEIEAEVVLAGERHRRVELELHGQTARRWPKKSYRIHFDEDVEVPFFGDSGDEVERLVLQASWIDPSFARNKLLFDLTRALGGLAPRVGYAELFLNGRSLGLYQVIERIDEEYLKSQGFSKDGNLYKGDLPHANWVARPYTLDGFSEQSNEDGKADDLADLFAHLDRAERTFEAYESRLATRVSFDDVDVWNWVMTFALNLDTFNKNYYMYHDPKASTEGEGAVFRIIQWDADASLGINWRGERHDRWRDSWLYSDKNRLSARMYAIPEYRRAYIDGFARLLETTLHLDALSRRVDTLLEGLEPHIRRDLARWKRATTFESERDHLKRIIALRHQVIGDALQRARAAPN